MSNISQITIYLKNINERVNEVALFSPLSTQAKFDTQNKTIAKRKWTTEQGLNLPHRLLLKAKNLFFRRHLSQEMKLQIVVAFLLSQQEIFESLLGNELKIKGFATALEKTAKQRGMRFQFPYHLTHPQMIAKELTGNLLENPKLFHSSASQLLQKERDEILLQILSEIERPPVTSVLEIASENDVLPIQLTTTYAKFEIDSIDPKSGKIVFERIDNQSIASHENKKLKNQRIVTDSEGKYVGSYSGAFSTPYHVLEQLLFLLQEEEPATYFLLDKARPLKIAEDRLFLFTSLFAWNELDKIQNEHEAIDSLHNKVLYIVKKNGEERILHLKLYHQNLSFNAFNKFPTPGEVKAHILDLNTLFFIQILPRALRLLKENRFSILSSMAEAIDQAREEPDFLKKQKVILDQIDAFQRIKKGLLEALEGHSSELGRILNALLKKPKVGGMDALIYTSLLMKELKILHHKNCETATDKTGAANAADKAAYAFYQSRKRHFLPYESSHDDKKLFEVLYSMYLVWEEPEINTGLSTGFIGEKYFRNLIQRNPEATRYLMGWLKSHPELYLGLSHYR